MATPPAGATLPSAQPPPPPPRPAQQQPPASKKRKRAHSAKAQASAADRTVVNRVRIIDEAAVVAGALPVGAAAPPPTVMLAPRVEQTARRLRLADEQWALARRLDEAPVETLAGQSRTSAPGSGPTAGDPVTAAAVRGRLATTLRQNAAAIITPRTRLAGADGTVGNYARFAERLQPHDEGRRFAQFFEEDPLDPAPPPPGTDPATYAMFRALFVELAAQQGAAASRSALPTRVEALAAAGEDVPRPREIPVLLRAYFQPFRLPPRPGRDRLCHRGERCLFRTVSREHGYVGREFYVHTPPPPEAPLGPCIDCLLFGWKVMVQQNLMTRVVPSQPLNTFRVLVGTDEYGGHCMLRTRVDNRLTGIDGHVPEYHLNMRAWVAIPEEHCAFWGLPPERRGRQCWFLAEAHMDFLQASAGPTAASTC